MSDHISTDDLLMIQDQIDHGTMTPEWRNRWAKLLAAHDTQAATIQRAKDALKAEQHEVLHEVKQRVRRALDGDR